MKMSLLGLLGASLLTVSAASSFASSANPLDLSGSVSSIECSGINNGAEMNYDGASKIVTLTVDGASSTYNLESIMKGVGNARLLARSQADGSHLLATIEPNGARSLIQVNATSYYVRCEVK